MLVAPLVGAWIETLFIHSKPSLVQSHPSWVRGLKPFVNYADLEHVMSHPSWVRGLKLGISTHIIKICSRTPRGCVD